jgi:hypothetical protein
MTTPSGTISLANVNTELGLAATTTISMNQTNVRTLAGVPSGAISMQNLQNKSNRVTASATISSDTTNYTLNTAKAPGYSAGTTDMTLTINPSIYVYSTSTGSYALTVDTSWASGDTVTIVNNGLIIGRGGNGGPSGPASGYPSPGGSGGGPALLVQRAITMNNLNRIAGGGGGGGGGASPNVTYGKSSQSVSGGGGGGGIGVSSGGTGYPHGGAYTGATGGSGSLTSAGSGGEGGQSATGGPGGPGGTYGSSGSAGVNRPPYGGGGGGSAGACIVGNSNITYTNTGTRNGSIS